MLQCCTGGALGTALGCAEAEGSAAAGCWLAAALPLRSCYSCCILKHTLDASTNASPLALTALTTRL
jgi:hypothetical protein